jgi:hypothetical protein
MGMTNYSSLLGGGEAVKVKVYSVHLTSCSAEDKLTAMLFNYNKIRITVRRQSDTMNE